MNRFVAHQGFPWFLGQAPLQASSQLNLAWKSPGSWGHAISAIPRHKSHLPIWTFVYWYTGGG